MDGIKSTGLAALNAYGTGSMSGSMSGAGALNKAASGIDGGASGASGASGSEFGNLLSSAMNQLQEKGADTQAKSEALAAGQGNLVDVVTAIAETEIALETMVSVRDKVISSYEEIMRMPI